MKLEYFNLVCLKEIFKQLKDLGYFQGIHIHQTNKHDVIVLLRNTGIVDEKPLNYISYYDSRENQWFKVFPTGKRYNKGEQVKNVRRTWKPIIVDFN